eukprot:gb/GECG01012837.1/.p1 GENE.gb/GECG01012837.1/~~gb/GECG01012837.1/.p1  ORF type:complete len:213 (+),score=35.24 gb/GECG01012837.1/:1-639(+)
MKTTMSFNPIPNEDALYEREQELRRFEQSLRALESSIHAKLSILQSSDVSDLSKEDIQGMLEDMRIGGGHASAAITNRAHADEEDLEEEAQNQLHYPGTALPGLQSSSSSSETIWTKYQKALQQLQEKDELILDLRQELAKNEARAEQLQHLLNLHVNAMGSKGITTSESGSSPTTTDTVPSATKSRKHKVSIQGEPTESKHNSTVRGTRRM